MCKEMYVQTSAYTIMGIFGGFHKWGYPQMDGLQWKNHIKLDDLGLPWATLILGNHRFSVVM